MAFRWRADDGPLTLVSGSSLPSSNKKNFVKVGPPLTKLPGSAHESPADLDVHCFFVFLLSAEQRLNTVRVSFWYILNVRYICS